MNINAKWINAAKGIGEVSPEFRKVFCVGKKVVKAELCVSALGLYVASINGTRVTDALMTPGWTSYGTRVQYQRYDITDLIKEHNTVSLLAAKGWAHSEIGWSRSPHKETSDISVIAALEVIFEDGEKQSVLTDNTWEVYSSHVLSSEHYDGEVIDLTVEPQLLGNACESETDKPMLVEQVGEFVKERERVFPSQLIITPKGERVIDFGQNLAGYVEIKLKGHKGDRIRITHGEVLDKEGNFYIENMRTAKVSMEYTLDGEQSVHKPVFVFQGFRYVRVDEYPTESIDLDDICAVAIYSDMKRTGSFVCGDDMINRLYSNAVWGQRSNFIDVPTDCPQRDERMGWTGDAQIFCRTASINYDTERFFRKWLGDMAIEQTEEGIVWGIVPRTQELDGGLSAAWGDAATVIPWEMYRAYGNKQDLKNNYPMMKKWVDFMHSAGDEEYLWLGTTRYGDWCAQDVDQRYRVGATQIDLIATAYFAYSTSLLIKAGRVLGEDMTGYEKLYENVRREFRRAFMKDGMPVIYPKCDGLAVKPAGTDSLSASRKVLAQTQTAITLILHFDLCEPCERAALAERLCQLIRENGGKMTTGFVGTPYILYALSENGKVKEAYDLLLQKGNPSWLFPVSVGATTIWERWDSMNENGDILKGMNSFNHYAYGSVFEWVYGNMLGIKVCEGGEGYRKVDIAPQPDKRIGFAEGAIDTRVGTLSVKWKYIGDKVRYEISVPDGMEANLKLCGATERTVSGGQYVIVC